MRSIGACLIHFGWMAIILSSLAVPPASIAQDYSAEEMNKFFLAWKQAMVASKESEARQFAQNNRVLAERVANGLGGKGQEALQENDRVRALALFEMTKTLFEHLDDKQGIAAASHDLGVYHQSGGDCEQALPHFIRASTLFQSLKMQELRAKSAQGIQLCVRKVALQDPSVKAVANLAVSPEGKQVVVYNRDKCEQAGMEVCLFYLVHEYGHMFLQHATNHVPLERSEPEADCWAARHVQTEVAKAAHAWFLKGAEVPKVHGSSEVRAEGIRRCAGL